MEKKFTLSTNSLNSKAIPRFPNKIHGMLQEEDFYIANM